MADNVPPKSTGMLLDGVFASEAIDSSGEVFDVAGADISDLEEGRGVCNWEHRGDDVPGASGLDIVGKIVFAKKIFKLEDCDNERQEMYWEKIGKLPFVYGIVRLYDGAGHIAAQALAAQIRDHVANQEPILVRYSIEGSTLEKEGNRLVRTVARRVAATIKPCNRTAISGVLVDPHAPEGFEKEPEIKAKDALDDIVDAMKHEHPLYSKLGGSTALEVSSPTVDMALVKQLLKQKVAKALTAGMPTGAPSTLTGGEALQREDLKKRLVNVAKAAIRDYAPEKHGPLRQFLKSLMPEASDDFLDHFEGLADDYRAKLKKADGDAPSLKAPAKKTKTPKPKKAPAAPVVKESLWTRGGELIPPQPAVKKTHFDVHTGTLHTKNGSLQAYNPDDDDSKGYADATQTKSGHWFRQVMDSDSVQRHWRPAIRSWLKVHQALRNGELPEAVVATATAFSLFSPNTPVPVQELMYAHYADATKEFGYDVRDPRFGEGSRKNVPPVPGTKKRPGRPGIPGQHSAIAQNILDRDSPDPEKMPQTARDYFMDPFEGIHRSLIVGAGSPDGEGRQPGEARSFQLASNHLERLELYHHNHKALVNVVQRHGADGRAAVEELMRQKHLRALWSARKDRFAAAGKPEPPVDGMKMEGLANKTTRFTYAMLGAGNIMVPDTHFIRHVYGLHSGVDGSTIEAIKSPVLWNVLNAPVLSDMDRWYFANHPAVKRVLGDSEFGQHFRSNPEQAIFPAFWLHWLSIAEHERMMGRGNAAVLNEQASHRPYFDEAFRFMADPVESQKKVPKPSIFSRLVRKSEDGSPMLHPALAAALLHTWYQKHGPEEALFRFYSHLVPLLAPDDAKLAKAEPEVLVRKMEAMSIDLRKAADGMSTKPERPKAPARVMFAGKEVKPGKGEGGDGQRLAVLHVDKDHVFAVPHEALGEHHASQVMKLPRKDEGRSYVLHSLPDTAVSNTVDADVHGLPYCNTSDEQRSLIHGLDVTTAAPDPEHMKQLDEFGNPGYRGVTKPIWIKNPQGKMVLVKGGRMNSGDVVGFARHEVAYHNAARDVFGLGHYVPTTSIFRSPVTGEEYSAQEMVPNAEHALMAGDVRTPEQGEVLTQLHDSGELDKLRIMNMVMGNADRHEANFVFTDDKTGPPMRLIDHGHALRYYSDLTPAYVDLGHSEAHTRDFKAHMAAGGDSDEVPGHPNAQPVHPDALQWLGGLDPQRLYESLSQSGIDDWAAEEAARNLNALKERSMHQAAHVRHRFFSEIVDLRPVAHQTFQIKKKA